MMHWGDYGWGMGYGWIFMIIFWALAILGVIYVVQALARGGKGAEQRETPLDTLKKRYAKGEITKQQFERMKDDIAKS
jgi:putative membrane protein